MASDSIVGDGLSSEAVLLATVQAVLIKASLFVASSLPFHWRQCFANVTTTTTVAVCLLRGRPTALADKGKDVPMRDCTSTHFPSCTRVPSPTLKKEEPSRSACASRTSSIASINCRHSTRVREIFCAYRKFCCRLALVPVLQPLL